MEMYVNPKDPQIERILYACGWETKRPISLHEFRPNMQVSNLFWDGGSRDEWRAVNLFDSRAVDLPVQEFMGRIQKISDIPDGTVLVCRQQRGLETFYVIHAKGITKFLSPAPNAEISEDMKKLLMLSGLISSYRKEYASKWGWNEAKYNSLKEEAIKMGFMTKNGAYTIDGKNKRIQLEKEGFRVYGL